MQQDYTAREIATITGKTKRYILMKAKKENWPGITGNGKGGDHRKYSMPGLPADIQTIIAGEKGVLPGMISSLAPEAALIALDQHISVSTFTDSNSLSRQRPMKGRKVKRSSTSVPPINSPSIYKEGIFPVPQYEFEKMPPWSPERAISMDTLTNPRVKKILGILQEVEAMPRDWNDGRRKWIEYVAAKNAIGWQSIYKWLEKYNKRGIAGIEHHKASRGNPKVWTPEALEHWIGLCLKPEHRKIDLRKLYEDALVIEAGRRDWRIGCLESATWWFNKKATPQLLAMQKGGIRALDNLLPPVLRDYSDLAPFEMLVGDQHRFDFWVVDDDTGTVFRPEGYAWQDLRTRIIYGMAFDRRYDAHLCGLALRVGMRIFGCFNAIYTDNGSSELSKYMMGILSTVRSFNMDWKMTDDVPLDTLDVDPEDVNPVIMPGTHKKAIVKNAKAKMIEGTWSVIEGILRSVFKLPGSVKRRNDDIHAQDIDHEEAMKLASQGKLPLFSEFCLTVYRAADHYNREKAHRGVRREWTWSPIPQSVTPLDCLKYCYADGWRPRMISNEATDMMFLKRSERIVQQGRITIDNETYEHDALLELHKQKVDIRYNPIEADLILVYQGNQFLCAAHPVEYSSMKNEDLARRKILEKRTRRKAIADSFRTITSHIPDLREYSKIPEAERVAAVIGEEKKRREIITKQRQEIITQEQLDEHVARMESGMPLSARNSKPLPVRPTYFLDDFSRFEWLAGYLKDGGIPTCEDDRFWASYMAGLADNQREYWESYISFGK